MTYWKTRFARLVNDEGGWIQAALLGAQGLSKLFGGGSKAAENSRMNQAQLQLGQDQLRNQQYQTGQNAQMQLANTDLARKDFTERARGGRAKQATLADMMMNFKPTSVSVPGVTNAEISGGMQIGEGAREALGNLRQQALLAQLAGDKFEGGEILNAPTVTPIPKPGKMEKWGDILATITGIAGAFAPQQDIDQGYGYVPRPGGR